MYHFLRILMFLFLCSSNFSEGWFSKSALKELTKPIPYGWPNNRPRRDVASLGQTKMSLQMSPRDVVLDVSWRCRVRCHPKMSCRMLKSRVAVMRPRRSVVALKRWRMVEVSYCREPRPFRANFHAVNEVGRRLLRSFIFPTCTEIMTQWNVI